MSGLFSFLFRIARLFHVTYAPIYDVSNSGVMVCFSFTFNFSYKFSFAPVFLFLCKSS